MADHRVPHDELDALRARVKADGSLRTALGSDRALLSRLASLTTPPPTNSSAKQDLHLSCLSASWLACALGTPPSAGQPRGSVDGARSSLLANVAARFGRGRRPEDGVRILSLDGGGTR